MDKDSKIFNSMQIDKPSKPTASVFTRIVATAIDAFIVVLLSVIGSFFIYRGVLSTNGTLRSYVENQNAHVESSHLAKSTDGSYYSYSSSDYYEQDDDGNYAIIKALSYFYLNYLTNSNLEEGDVGSLNFNEEVEPGIAQKDYYTVSWFNENVLKLPKPGETSDVDYFVYQKDGENNDYSKVGTVNEEKYVATIEQDGQTTKKVEMSKEMETFTYEAYKKAIDILYGQQFFKNWNNTLELTSSLITLGSRLFMVLIMFVLLPILLKDGKTLGKLLLKVSLMNKNDESIKKWQVPLRALFYILIPVIMFFVTNAYINIGIILVLLIASIAVMALSKKKTALHDLVAGTIVVDDYYKKKLKEQEEAEKLIKEELPLEEDEEVVASEETVESEKLDESTDAIEEKGEE